MNKELKTNNRGFSFITFEDSYGNECSLQESSNGTSIWLGIDEVQPTISIYDLLKTNTEYVPGDALRHSGRNVNFKLPEGCNNLGRMHLSREQVKELLPHLINFAEKGELC